ncbi:aspartyl protease family protein [Mucilaginibacter myungsuensis]|uniref:Aspartyl protease family protein n=1 Tax=Mucilaginibacter myungsuensis TaxID=649104 RepID=A0A929KVL7_9SPHI|nr:aspartyl protease family protein [Mucilaginibacter myungsuensis]MBE9661258.1 aspartyl protease family protein [Mucilaginibacter myungsuensis]MDN3597401.1 aspartyl protease family protein [Mucilaginibacter myungsuensis]
MQINGFGWIVRYLCVALLLAFSPAFAHGQSFDLLGKKKRVYMPFTTIRNMVIVKMSINDKGPFNFVLDTGVGIMLITEPRLVDSLNLATKHLLKIYGLNGESFDAYITPPLKLDMPNIQSTSVQAAILKDDQFGLSNYAGMPIHGLLGYDFFNNLAVRFNFYDSTLVISKPKHVRLLSKGIKIPLSIEDKKPYIYTNVKMADGSVQTKKLLVDIGAGHPLSIENSLESEGMPQNFIAGNLGLGITGPITGYISRIKEIDLGKYKIKDPITSFPDQESLKKALPLTPRDGNMGIGILRRFTMIIDYTNGAMYLKKGIDMDEPFEHDMSGIEYFFIGNDYSNLVVGRVEPGSAADAVGMKPKDEILAINFKPVDKLTIDQIDNLFKSKDGRNLLLEVYRNKEYIKVLLTLRKRI